MTAVCAVLLLACVASIWRIVTVGELHHFFSHWFLNYALAASIVTLISVLGLWQMHRWGVKLYATTFVTTQVVTLAAGYWQPSSTLVPLAILFVLLSSYREMS